MSNPKIIQIAFRGDILFGLSDEGVVYRQVMSENKKGFACLIWKKEMDNLDA